MKPKLIRITTISDSLNHLLKGQLRYLNKYYEVVGVSSGEKSLEELSLRENVRTIDVSMKREINLICDFKSLINLILIFRKEKPFIVHANTPKGSLLAMIAAYIVRVPHRVYTVTGLRFETATGKFRALLILMEKITCWCATKVIPEGDGVKSTLIKYEITNKPLEKVFNGNINGIDIQFFDPNSDTINYISKPCSASDFVFCFVGRMVKDKGLNELIASFIRLYNENPNIRLILVGPFEDNLDPVLPKTKSEIFNHPGILFVGFQEDIRPFLMSSDALVFPSYREGFPNVVLQAGAMGLPSIVTDINGANEIIENGVNGIIIPPKDESALYSAMSYFVENRNTDVLLMSKNARPMIIERYEQHKVWEALLKEYKSLESSI